MGTWTWIENPWDIPTTLWEKPVPDFLISGEGRELQFTPESKRVVQAFHIKK